MTRLTVHSDRALNWDASVFELLKKQIQQIQRERQRPVIIAICGGSATGKSTQVAQSLKKAFDSQALLFHQDNFQNLPEQLSDLNPRYRQDAPENYGFAYLPKVLEDLRSGRSAEIPKYVFQKRSHEGTQTLTPCDIVLFEGLYSAHSSIVDKADFVVYVEMRAIGRVLRRSYRGLYERYGRVNFANVFWSFCTSVLAAHMECVRKQRDRADLVIRMPYTFSETLDRFPITPVMPHAQLPRSGPVIKEYAVDSESRLQLIGTSGSNWMEVRFTHREQIYFCFTAGPELSNRIMATDWNGV
ncbi:MAG: uridine kinase family protein [Opitutales bacterium]